MGLRATRSTWPGAPVATPSSSPSTVSPWYARTVTAAWPGSIVVDQAVTKTTRAGRPGRHLSAGRNDDPVVAGADPGEEEVRRGRGRRVALHTQQREQLVVLAQRQPVEPVEQRLRRTGHHPAERRAGPLRQPVQPLRTRAGHPPAHQPHEIDEVPVVGTGRGCGQHAPPAGPAHRRGPPNYPIDARQKGSALRPEPPTKHPPPNGLVDADPAGRAPWGEPGARGSKRSRPRRTRVNPGSGSGSGSSQASISGHDLVGDVEVGVDVLHVVAVLERVDQLEDLARAVLVERHRARSARTTTRPTRTRCRRPAARCAPATRSVGSETTSNASPRSLTSSAPASSTASSTSSSVSSPALGTITTPLRVNMYDTRAGVGERAAVAGQRGAHLGRGAVAVVGEALDEQGDAVRAVALVHDRLLVGAAGLQRRSRA